jgi:F0F1-type ATP synthase membrane subunit c/vacuolar-type H+-ATPase subunit K
MTRRSKIRFAVIGGALAILLTGCASDSGVGESACDQAFAQAMAVDPASDTASSFDGAIASCPSLEAWVAAASRYPDTTAGQDPVAYAVTRCTSTPGIADSLVCVGLPGESTP